MSSELVASPSTTANTPNGSHLLSCGRLGRLSCAGDCTCLLCVLLWRADHVAIHVDGIGLNHHIAAVVIRDRRCRHPERAGESAITRMRIERRRNNVRRLPRIRIVNKSGCTVIGIRGGTSAKGCLLRFERVRAGVICSRRPCYTDACSACPDTRSYADAARWTAYAARTQTRLTYATNSDTWPTCASSTDTRSSCAARANTRLTCATNSDAWPTYTSSADTRSSCTSSTCTRSSCATNSDAWPTCTSSSDTWPSCTSSSDTWPTCTCQRLHPVFLRHPHRLLGVPRRPLQHLADLRHQRRHLVVLRLPTRHPAER